MFSKILIANRGEIACRVIKTWAVITGLAIMILSAGTDDGYAREIPMWEGVTKSEQQLQADQDLIEAARQKTGGKLDAAARRGVQLAWQAIAKGDAEGAIRRLNQAWLINPKRGDIYWAFGVSTAIRGDALAKVDRYFSKAESIIGPEVRLYSDWGRSHEERKSPNKAKQLFLKALDLDPNHIEAHVGMVRVAKQQGDSELARHHLETLKRLGR
ncbi:biotin carboxylase N-terminal domain-containing protein [Hoeflea sp.]|uniref:biotin carboxylase N-terminal domain-containing protein n=1 Tax=Hoeflea sp. TaxID=1940281 RepID=UPI003A9117F1